MKAHWMVGAIAALSLAACEQPKEEEAGAIEESEVSEAEDAGPDFSEGSVALSISGRSGTSDETLSVSECMIVNDGANGVIRAGGGAFELIWSETGFSLVWGGPDGLVTGKVAGSIDGDTVAFEGTLGETTVKGEVNCD